MSIGPMGFVSSVAGSSLAQTKGSELERTGMEVAGHERQQDVGRKAENAQGIGATDGEEHQTAERDADGRRLWEAPLGEKKSAAGELASPQADEHRAKDPSGESGGQLDLLG